MLLSVEHLDKRFEGKVPLQVLHDVCFQIDAGELVAMVGPSGAGKTTVLNIVSTLDSPTAGRVMIHSVDVHRMAERKLNRFRNTHLGFVFQDDLLLPHLTAQENVMLPGRIARTPERTARRRAQELLDRVGLSQRMDHRPGELSGGQRQRVNLARALFNQPSLMLADEPTARLDRNTGMEIVKLLADLNAQLGVTILMVTHEREVANRARRVIEFLDGRVVGDKRST